MSFFTTVGNYDYGFYWYLYLDGTIQFEAKATGIVFTGPLPGRRLPVRLADRARAGRALPPAHVLRPAGHGRRRREQRRATSSTLKRLPIGPGNPHGNAFSRSRTVLGTESDARRKADGSVGRVWEIVNTEKTNVVGEPVAYTLFPEGQPTLAAADLLLDRAARRLRHRAPVGDPVRRGRALPGRRLREPERRQSRARRSTSQADRGIDGEDIVLWHSFGLTHFPRTEDWPIMPVDYTGFTLKPTGFFDRNPALDVPPSPAAHGCHGGEGCRC